MARDMDYSGLCQVIVLAVTFSVISGFSLDELIHDVLKDYEPAARPSCGDISATRVTIDLALRQIVELDEPRQFLNTIIWMRLAWNDCRLQWNASNYAGVDYVTLPNDKIWVPDVTLYDNAENKLSGITDGYHLVVTNNGNIRYNFPSVIKSLCAVAVNHFPFDYQACQLKFGSWAYSGADVDIWNSSNAVDLSSFVLNTEWMVDSTPIYRIETRFGSDVYATINCILKLKRRPLFYAMNLIFPCCLISLLAILGFLLPPAAGEKVNLEITILLSLSVFQLIVLELMPPSGDSVSFIGLYFLVSMTLVGLSCLATVIVLNVHFHGQTGVPCPYWASRFIRGPIARLIRIDTSPLQMEQLGKDSGSHAYRRYERRSSGMSRNITPATVAHTHESLHDYIGAAGSREHNGNNVAVEKPNGHVHAHTHNGIQCSHQDFGGHPDVLVSSLMTEVRDSLTNIEQQLQSSCASNSGSDWYVLARMLDRIFLMMYIVFLTVSGLTLILQFVANIEKPALWDKYH